MHAPRSPRPNARTTRCGAFAGALLASAVLAGCAERAALRSEPAAPAPDIARAAPSRPDQEPAVAPRVLQLPAAWSSLPSAAFEDALDRWSPHGAPAALTASALVDLRQALQRDDATALRAVLLLAHSGDPAGAEALVGLLERRERGTAESRAAAAVAAAALAAPPPRSRAEVARRLAELGAGERPHPILAVRIECAASALRLGRVEVIPLLLTVLREGTAAQASDPPWRRGSFPQIELEWVQSRAAQALSQRAGVRCTYRPEASAQERAETAAALAQLLAADRKTAAARPSLEG